MMHLRTITRTALVILSLAGAVPAGVAADTATPVAVAGSYRLDRDHAKLIWAVRHLGFSDYYGEFTDFDASLTLDPVDPAKNSLTATIRIASLSTNNPKLDGHLASKDFFNAASFPESRFISTSITQTGPTRALVKGDLTLLGMTKPVELDVTLTGAGLHPFTKKQMAGFSATASLKRSDFGMNFMLPGIGDTVTLILSAEFARE